MYPTTFKANETIIVKRGRDQKQITFSYLFQHIVYEPEIIQYIDEDLKNNMQFAKRCLAITLRCLPYFSKRLKSNKEFAKYIIEKDFNAYRFLDKNLQNNKDMIDFYQNLYYKPKFDNIDQEKSYKPTDLIAYNTSDGLTCEPAIIFFMHLQNGNYMILKDLSQTDLYRNIDFAKQCISYNYHSFECFHQSIQLNPEIMEYINNLSIGANDSLYRYIEKYYPNEFKKFLSTNCHISTTDNYETPAYNCLTPEGLREFKEAIRTVKPRKRVNEAKLYKNEIDAFLADFERDVKKVSEQDRIYKAKKAFPANDSIDDVQI